MKNLTTLATILICFNYSYSQNANTVDSTANETTKKSIENFKKVILEYSNESKSFELVDCDTILNNICKKDIRDGATYEIIVKGINTAVINSKIEAKPYNINSKTPEIIKPLFIGITETSDAVDMTALADSNDTLNLDLETIYEEAIRKYNSLTQLKIMSDSLYEATIFTPKPKLANRYFEKVAADFDIDDVSSLLKEIIGHKQYIEAASNLIQTRIGKIDSVNAGYFGKHSQLLSITMELNKNEYLKYAKFISTSRTSENHTKPEKFTSKFDGTDLNITLINSYMKDTIVKKTIEFYSYGKFSFDFSTGFFYSNQTEKSYFTRKRDSLKNDIIREDTRDFDISFGALGHLSYKFTSNFKAGISMGASLSPLDGKTRYLLGGSMLFGKRNQLAINGGLSLLKLKIISGSVLQDSGGRYVASSITTVPTFEKIQKGFFFGLTYNLTATKKYSK